MSKSPLLEQVREVLRLRHYSIRTEEAYVQTIRRFILYHRKRHPRDMGVGEIRQYLSTVALCALLFLYRQGARNLFAEHRERRTGQTSDARASRFQAWSGAYWQTFTAHT